MTPPGHICSNNTGDHHIFNQVVEFSRLLHNAGISVNPAKLIDLFRCIEHIDISNPEDFYTASRATLISSHRDLAVFDYLYESFWYGRETRKQTRPFDPGADGIESADQKNQQDKLQQTRDTGSSDQQNNRQNKPEATRSSYSADEYLMKKDLGQMTPDELEQARRLVSELVRLIAHIRSRRRKMSKRGHELFFRRMFRHTSGHGSDNLKMVFRNKRKRKTRLILLCDVSGSMEDYSRFLIQIIYAMRQELKELEVAVFSTHMTVITDCLSLDNIGQSLDMITETVHDWAGGTNIGQCLDEFNRSLSREISSARTIIVILSDGWDRGDAGVMAREMQRLHENAYRILWLNPLLGNDEYQPLCQGMRTALPWIDYFLPAHNLESFAGFLDRLEKLWR